MRAPRQFSAPLAEELTRILSSSSSSHRPFLKNWTFDQCRFVDARRSALEITLSRASNEKLHLSVAADDFVGTGYDRFFHDEEGATSYSALAVNLSTLVQETVEPRRSGSAALIPLRP